MARNPAACRQNDATHCLASVPGLPSGFIQPSVPCLPRRPGTPTSRAICRARAIPLPSPSRRLRTRPPRAVRPAWMPARLPPCGQHMRLQVRFSPQLGPSHLSHTPPPPQRPAASARMPSAFDAMTVVADFDSRSSYRKNQTCQNAPHHHTPDPHGMRPGVTRTRHFQPRPHLRSQRIVRAQRIACIPSASELASHHNNIYSGPRECAIFCGLFFCKFGRCSSHGSFEKGVNQQHGLAANWSR